MKFTKLEARLARECIRIAQEDGSIYGGHDDDPREVAKTNAALVRVVTKISALTGSK